MDQKIEDDNCLALKSNLDGQLYTHHTLVVNKILIKGCKVVFLKNNSVINAHILNKMG